MRRPSRVAVSLGWRAVVLCLALVVAGLAGGADYLHYLGDVPANVWAAVVGLAAFCALFVIGGHYWPKLRLILYGAFIVAVAVLSAASGDTRVIEALGGLAVVGIFIALLFVLTWINSRAKAMLAVGAYLVVSVILLAFGQLGAVVALFWLAVVAGIFLLPGYVGKRLKQRQPKSPPLDPRRLPG